LLAAVIVPSANADRLVIKGSDTLGAKPFRNSPNSSKRNIPALPLTLPPKDPTTGIAAIIDGTAQIGMSSRRAKRRKFPPLQAKA